ncbi:MAG: tRNA (adenosine(37)-N6)-threonylcarbamoyltransferase complex ATPase subunit type 1 TsaE [Desulfuromonadaceae bacterium]|nr:tRNA (adenosine(37)-N6)-threonylcarbamoyltransferase complex ATPase subunit type 1 TsaE [Desulfuromonadaceae bacterium]MDD5105362.1 tRNA (adenosine(37)-N6)-threonylcarbamoyltransferase complex ATPase subunit type 1 TsaE [Desulfuromonadaceae bacterium]
MSRLQIITSSSRETEELGAKIGSFLQPGSFLALRGELGGGKTCLTRGVVAAVAPQSAHVVASPTYAIMNCYPGDTPVYHFDFYRLTGDDDIVELGFEEYFYGNGVCVAEWSERISDLMPCDVVTVLLERRNDDERLITLTGSGIKSDAVLAHLAKIV